METTKLKRFAQYARRSLLEQVSSKLKLVLDENSAARRERAGAIRQLEEAIKEHGREQLIERVAYTWFNRFSALRFMDINRYNNVNLVSPADPGQFQPEILADAKMGHIDEKMVPEKIRQQIFALLSGSAPSHDPQGEAYRLLLVAACNFWNKTMPFLFQHINDYTELLMPDDLLSGNSILSLTREAMTPDVCEDVEVIGWLYQFYISEKKDAVFDGLKKNKKITPENIPAATQLFTPHWIVRYLVENSLGRLWMQNRPNSRLKERMEYYIAPAEEEPRIDTNGHEIEKKENKISVNSCSFVVQTPEEIKICDPACGSGHMLTYAFDLLYAIYEEEGVDPAEIPEKILTHNLYGIEIDKRAGELAAFALTMKALQYDKRFLRRSSARGKLIEPNICVLENVALSVERRTTNEHEWTQILNAMCRAGVDQEALTHDLTLFSEADNFGSLLRPHLPADQIQKAMVALMAYDESVRTPSFGHGELLHKCKKALTQADFLSQKYHVVIANPPYMGGKGMNGRLGAWLKDNYSKSKSDLFAAFIERNIKLAQPKGMVSMITMQSWMFLSSFEALRAEILNKATLVSMAHLGARAFDSIGGEVVSTTAFILESSDRPDYRGGYLRLVDGNSEEEKENAIKEAVQNPECGWFFRASAADFKKIPGYPIAYWPSPNLRNSFNRHRPLSQIAQPKQGLATTDNDRFLRYWFECANDNICHGARGAEDVTTSCKKWFPCQKGGEFRKWYGNNEYLVNWNNNGEEIKKIVIDRYGSASKRVVNEHLYFKEGITWSSLSSSSLSMRYVPYGFIFETKGSMCFFSSQGTLYKVLGFCNSNIVNPLLQCISPTLDYHEGPIGKLPIAGNIDGSVVDNAKQCIEIGNHDWDSIETSWDFTSFPLLNPDYLQPTLKATYQKLRSHWKEMTLEMKRLEEENNRIFINAYGLQDELTPEVPLNEITLTCNPYYRYGKEELPIDTSKHESKENIGVHSCSFVVQKEFPIDPSLEDRLLADTMKEFISYAVGCMFGRYALNKPGLILANQGETIEDYYRKLQEPQITTNGHEGKDKENIGVDSCSFVVKNSFEPDKDNVIPMLDGDWFTDDISERFRAFLKITFGAEHYEENLRFMENALGKDIRKYFLKDFYTDHVKRYKKRPIYWLFSSPKGSFNALIYMHRYRSDTVSVVLNDYLREFRTKLTSHKNHLEAVSISASSSQSEKTRALKESLKISRMITEMEEYERDVLYPLATEQVEIDLDDGVKVNYPKLGAALKKIVGLEATEE